VRLHRIEADRLRNLKAVDLELPPGLTLIAGRNGRGKTSLLEAIYLLGTGRSFRTRKLDELLSWDGGPLRIAGGVESRQGLSKLGVVIDEGQRTLLADRAILDLEAFLGRLDLVDLTADRAKVLRGGPEERRRFLDRGVLGIRASYLRSIGDYRRILQQRNALLRGGGHRSAGSDVELDAWDERLILAATEIHRKRREYAVLLAASLGEIGRVLFPGGGELTLRYLPSPSRAGEAAPADFSRILKENLDRGRPRDRMVGHTCHGPHRDDLKVELDGVDLRKFGSAGQLRASLVALKLGKLSVLHEDRGDPPLFLMDDFDTDLDEPRAAALAGFLEGGGFQTLVATSKENLADHLGVSFVKVRVGGGKAQID